MPLSNDQKALLRLLAQREEGYGDIAALMGLSVDEVRRRVKEALTELDEGGSAAGPVAAEDESAGAAGPVAAGDPPPPAVAKASSGVGPPTAPPAAEASTAKAEKQTPVSAEPRQAIALPKGRRLWELVGGALVALLLVLFATGAIDLGGDDDSDSGGDAGQTSLTDQIPAGSKQPTQAVLEGADGSDASGQALFGRFKQQVLLVVAAEGLEPTPQGQSYAISLVRSPTQRIPVAATRVGEAGTISEQFQVAPNVLGLLATGYDEMEISLVVNKALRQALTRAQSEKAAPNFSGTVALSGPVTGPIVSAGDAAGD